MDLTLTSLLPGYMLWTTIVRIIVTLIGLFWIAQRTPIPQWSRLMVGGVLSLVLLGWVALIVNLTQANVFRIDETTTFPPPILLGVLLPILVGLLAFYYWRPFRQVIDRVPQHWLIGIQVFRITGGIFLVLYLNGMLPAEFAIPAGMGDVFVGLTALPVAYFCWVQKPWARKVARIWNYVGIADFAIAVPLGVLTSPSSVQLLALDAPNLLTSTYPVALFPTFSVPLGIILHLYSLALLRQHDDKQIPTTSTGWRVMAVLAVAVSLYATIFYLVLPNVLGWPLGWQVHPALQQTFAEHPIGLYVHIVPSILALLLGPFQFRADLRQRRPRLHRMIGRVYLFGVFFGGLGGLYMAQFAAGGVASQSGFSLLALLWLASGGMALFQIRRGELQRHQAWMMRNYALTLAAVTLRFYTRLFFLAGMELPDFHAINAWLCWVPNLIIAEWLIRRNNKVHSTTRLADSSVNAAGLSFDDFVTRG